MVKEKVVRKKASSKPVQVFKGMYFIMTGKKPKNIYSLIKKHGGTVFSNQEKISNDFSKQIILLTKDVGKDPVTFKYLFALSINALILNYNFIEDSIKHGKIRFPLQDHYVHPRGRLNLSYHSVNSVVPQRASQYEEISHPTPFNQRLFFNRKFSIINYNERSFYDSWSHLLRSAGARVVDNRFERDVDYFLVQKEELLDHRSYGFAKQNRQVIVTTVFIVDSLILNRIVPLIEKNCIYHPPLNLSKKNPFDSTKPKKMVSTPVRTIPKPGPTNTTDIMNDEEEEVEEEVEEEGGRKRDPFLFLWTGEPFEVKDGVKYFYRFEMGTRTKRSFYCVRDVVEIRIKSSNRTVLGVITKCYEEWSGRKRIKYRTLCNRPEISKRKNELFLIEFEDSAEVNEVQNHVDVYHYVCDESHGLYCTRECNPENKQVSEIEDVIWNIPHRNANLLYWLDLPINDDPSSTVQQRKYHRGVSINGHQFFVGHVVSIKCVHSGRFCQMTGRIERMFELKMEKYLELGIMRLDESVRLWKITGEVKKIRFDNIQKMKSLMIVEDPLSACKVDDEDDILMKDDEDEDMFYNVELQ